MKNEYKSKTDLERELGMKRDMKRQTKWRKGEEQERLQIMTELSKRMRRVNLINKGFDGNIDQSLTRHVVKVAARSYVSDLDIDQWCEALNQSRVRGGGVLTISGITCEPNRETKCNLLEHFLVIKPSIDRWREKGHSDGMVLDQERNACEIIGSNSKKVGSVRISKSMRNSTFCKNNEETYSLCCRILMLSSSSFVFSFSIDDLLDGRYRRWASSTPWAAVFYRPGPRRPEDVVDDVRWLSHYFFHLLAAVFYRASRLREGKEMEMVYGEESEEAILAYLTDQWAGTESTPLGRIEDY